jgi:hypothetical protein
MKFLPDAVSYFAKIMKTGFFEKLQRYFFVYSIHTLHFLMRPHSPVTCGIRYVGIGVFLFVGEDLVDEGDKQSKIIH